MTIEMILFEDVIIFTIMIIIAVATKVWKG